MSGKKKNSKKNPRSGQPKPLIRLSQCMIVKNEEKNIERALSWAKDIAFEQIVVDTGSSDRTVEIAESLGAKVYHYEWINDFAAAKNYAIEQASGNWIAFLDADEYFSPEDAKKLMTLLKQMHENPESRKSFSAVRCLWIQLDDKNKPFAVLEQDRIFKNRPDIRYEGKIHETLTLSGQVARVTEISIMHTGYTKSVYAETNKSDRNVKMLREELNKRPDDPNIMIYLADCLFSDTDGDELTEAVELYKKALLSDKPKNHFLVEEAYSNLISTYLRRGGMMDEVGRLSRIAAEQFPQNPDLCFFYAVFLNRTGNPNTALDKLKQCEAMLNTLDVSSSSVVMTQSVLLFHEMATAAHELGDKNSVVKYSTYALKEDNRREGILPLFLYTLKASGATDDEVIGLLGKLYDFSSVKDKLFIAHTAKDAGAVGFAGKIIALITDEERKWMSGGAAGE